MNTTRFSPRLEQAWRSFELAIDTHAWCNRCEGRLTVSTSDGMWCCYCGWQWASAAEIGETFEECADCFVDLAVGFLDGQPLIDRTHRAYCPTHTAWLASLGLDRETTVVRAGMRGGK